MARQKSDNPKPEIRDKDITGLKYFEKLLPLFRRLHEVGCDRDAAGNRDLHFDEYCCLVLLFFFNPIVGSVHALSQASALMDLPKDCVRWVKSGTDGLTRDRFLRIRPQA